MNATPNMDTSSVTPDVNSPPPPISPASDETTSQRVEADLDTLDELFKEVSYVPGDNATALKEVFAKAPMVTVVIPVYNEENTILEVLSRVQELTFRMEVIVVDDCSTDGTRDLLETVRDMPGLRVILKSKNEGKGAALRDGFAAAEGDIVVIQDADLEYNPAEIPTVIRPLLDGDADAAFGSRFLRDTQDRSLTHRLLNRFLTTASNTFTGLHLTDMETCYKAFRRNVIRDLPLKQNRFGFEPEVTAKLARRRYRVVESPIGYKARGYDEGKKIGMRDFFNAVYCIVRYGLAD
jgi:glycosyltransferase involved in cell wall biosynthesis